MESGGTGCVGTLWWRVVVLNRQVLGGAGCVGTLVESGGAGCAGTLVESSGAGCVGALWRRVVALGVWVLYEVRVPVGGSTSPELIEDDLYGHHHGNQRDMTRIECDASCGI